MRKISLALLLVFAIAKTNAQNYQISFAGTGASSTVDSVKVENLTQCTDTVIRGEDILNLTATLGINESDLAADNAINLFPNPMTGNCSVNFIATSQGKTTIGLYDITGKRILQVQDFLEKGSHTYRLSGIDIGVYTLKIESDKYHYQAKIVNTNATFGKIEIKHIETKPIINEQTTASNQGKLLKHLKSSQSIIYMQYNTGDILMLTGKSSIYRTVFMLVPTQNQTINFNFVNCTDADGNHYSVVQIDTMIWMAENLKTTRYRNGDTIPNLTNGIAWSYITTGAYCNYNNTTNSDTINTYGRLYNWYAGNDSSNIAPQGWHVASDSEWISMITYLGGVNVAGGKLKEVCRAHWNSPNTGATNEVGFTALPGGYRVGGGAFVDIGLYGGWWSSTEISPSTAWYGGIVYCYTGVYSYGYDKYGGYSVRCVKD